MYDCFLAEYLINRQNKKKKKKTRPAKGRGNFPFPFRRIHQWVRKHAFIIYGLIT